MKINNYIRDVKGRFQNKWFKIIPYMVVIAMILTIVYLSQLETTVEYIETEKVVVIDTTKEIIAKEKSSVLDALTACECDSAKYKEKECFNWDDGGIGKNRTSWGKYQFKISTVQMYVKGISDWDALNLAMDYREARELVSHIIFETKGGIHNWSLCAKKDGLLARVEFIKQLESKIKDETN